MNVSDAEHPAASRTEPGIEDEREPVRRRYRDRGWPHADHVVEAAEPAVLAHWDPTVWERVS